LNQAKTDNTDSTADPGAGAPPKRLNIGFTEGPVGRHLVRLGSFMAMGTVTMNIAQLAEAVYLGILGTEALAAMGFAFPLTITLFAFAGGIGSGSSSVIARAMGAGDKARASRLITHAQVLTLIMGTLLGALGVAYATEIIGALGAKDRVLDLTIQYLQVYMLGFPFFMLSIVGSTLLRATGSAASPGIIMTVGSVLQIVLGPILIFGWFGVPELGIAGAAWAYVGSRILSVVLYGWLLVKTRLMSWDFRGIFESWAAIMHVGGPAIASGLVMPASMLIITRLLANHGHEVVAGYNVASRVETMAHMILWSCSSSVEPFVGQNWGARKFERVRRALFLSHSFCLAWGVVTFVVMILFGSFFVSLIDDNPVVIDTATTFFIWIPLSIGFMGMMQVANSSFNARGMPMPALAISLLRSLIIYVPLALLGDYLWGYTGIFVATALTNVVLGAVAWQWNRASVESQAAKLTIA
jgi:putative MATE family efflux protein